MYKSFSQNINLKVFGCLLFLNMAHFPEPDTRKIVAFFKVVQVGRVSLLSECHLKLASHDGLRRWSWDVNPHCFLLVLSLLHLINLTPKCLFAAIRIEKSSGGQINEEGSFLVQFLLHLLRFSELQCVPLPHPEIPTRSIVFPLTPRAALSYFRLDLQSESLSETLSHLRIEFELLESCFREKRCDRIFFERVKFVLGMCDDLRSLCLAFLDLVMRVWCTTQCRQNFDVEETDQLRKKTFDLIASSRNKLWNEFVTSYREKFGE